LAHPVDYFIRLYWYLDNDTAMCFIRGHVTGDDDDDDDDDDDIIEWSLM